MSVGSTRKLTFRLPKGGGETPVSAAERTLADGFLEVLEAECATLAAAEATREAGEKSHKALARLTEDLAHAQGENYPLKGWIVAEWTASSTAKRPTRIDVPEYPLPPAVYRIVALTSFGGRNSVLLTRPNSNDLEIDWSEVPIDTLRPASSDEIATSEQLASGEVE